MNNETYWDGNFLDYWVDVTSASNKGIKNTIPSDEVLVSIANKAISSPNEKLLDLGCSFGRIYSYIKGGCDYYGIDISQEAIDTAKKTYPEIMERLYVGPAERLPFDSGEFDVIIMLGVFDACYQEAALFEALRVLKNNGKLLITGKHFDYEFDDDEAFIAEVNARKKEHPNYFTNTIYMMEQLRDNGCRVNGMFFKRRGDFARLAYVEEPPEKFYEYALFITKEKAVERAFLPFNGFYSKTFSDRVVIQL